jgi:hypothetical protein
MARLKGVALFITPSTRRRTAIWSSDGSRWMSVARFWIASQTMSMAAL